MRHTNTLLTLGWCNTNLTPQLMLIKLLGDNKVTKLLKLTVNSVNIYNQHFTPNSIDKVRKYRPV